MTLEELELRRALVFAILMQNGDGIMGKSPGYVEEKWQTVRSYDRPCQLLDSTNKAIFDEWIAKWLTHLK